MRRLLSKILILHLIFVALASVCLAQEASNNQPNEQNAEVFGENDRLPFMQNQETAASSEPSSGGLMLKTLGAMLLIVGLIFFGAWGAKKLGFGNLKSNASGDDLQLNIISSVSLGNGRTISTVRFGERVLVVGSTPQSFTLLAEETSGEKISYENSRSVAEMLAEENYSFEEGNLFRSEFEEAQNRLFLREEKGEQI